MFKQYIYILRHACFNSVTRHLTTSHAFILSSSRRFSQYTDYLLDGALLTSCALLSNDTFLTRIICFTFD
jgi:hypothetical protein